jgi:hypothetical protein
MIGAARFLLDQGFPPDPIGTFRLDKRVEYVPLHRFAPELSESTTPDWMLYVAAAAGGFQGLVTGDKSQLSQDAELIALTVTRITLVTWRHGDEDPITRWGQLLAYMPQILRRMEPGKGIVVSIPNPRLGAGSNAVEIPGHMARARSAQDKVSYNERRSRELAHMRPYLVQRGHEDWLQWLESRS